jgi:hypothetical protein
MTTTPSELDPRIQEYISRCKEIFSGLEFFAHANMVDETGISSNYIIEFKESSTAIIETDYSIIDHTQFIHYTSVENLFNIINSGELRLYNINNLNDPQELKFAIKNIGIDVTKFNLRFFQNSFFVTSLCGYSDIEKDNFNLWRLYGREGRGVGIVLSFENEINSWEKFLLGKVIYGENNESIKKLKRLIDFHHEFNNRQNIHFNYPRIFAAFSLFHKNEIWKMENEYRMICYCQSNERFLDTRFDDKILINHGLTHSIDTNGNLISYIRIPFVTEKYKNTILNRIEESSGIKLINSKPNIKIRKVILGYNLPDKLVTSVITALPQISVSRLGYKISVEISHLKKYF